MNPSHLGVCPVFTRPPKRRRFSLWCPLKTIKHGHQVAFKIVFVFLVVSLKNRKPWLSCGFLEKSLKKWVPSKKTSHPVEAWPFFLFRVPGTSFFLPKLIGRGRASEALLTGRPVLAPEAGGFAVHLFFVCLRGRVFGRFKGEQGTTVELAALDGNGYTVCFF